MPEAPFQIRHPDGRQYALRSVAVFLDRYEPEGFAITNPPPVDYVYPADELSEERAKRKPKPQPKASVKADDKKADEKP